MTCQEELREMLKGMCERVKTTLHRGKTLTANFIRFVRVPRALNLEMAVGMFPRKILITNRDVDEGPVGDSCSSRDRVREPVCQLSRKSDRSLSQQETHVEGSITFVQLYLYTSQLRSNT